MQRERHNTDGCHTTSGEGRGAVAGREVSLIAAADPADFGAWSRRRSHSVNPSCARRIHAVRATARPRTKICWISRRDEADLATRYGAAALPRRSMTPIGIVSFSLHCHLPSAIYYLLPAHSSGVARHAIVYRTLNEYVVLAAAIASEQGAGHDGTRACGRDQRGRDQRGTARRHQRDGAA